ncbi:hypothetical protein KKD95_02285 [Patescibacteria group bacterium]|nr:hypothetical protein [Patescibacteria group bacterium]
MIKKRYSVPALILGISMIGGSTAFAMGPGGFNLAAFSSFSTDEQAAIQQANDIQSEARTQAQAVLEAAGVTQDEMRKAMGTYHEQQRANIEATLEDNDYAGYAALVAGSPQADALTEDVFSKLVEIHQLQKDGDREGAMELRKELADSGFKMGGGHGSRPDGGKGGK